MKNPNTSKFLLSIIILICVNCGRPFTAISPDGFAVYTDHKSFRSISPEKTVYRVRTCKNQPYADFDFWREALPERMKNAGYRVIGDTVLTTNKNKSLLLELAAPLGETDYSYLVMITVKKKKILIAEAAGAYESFQRIKPAVITALGKTILK